MIRTANLTDSISRKAGGLHESVRRLVQSLRVCEVEVRVLTVEDEFTGEDLAVWQPVPVDIFPRSWPFAFGYAPGFLQVLQDYGPDLTHTHGIWLYPSIATAAYCTRRRVPYMISPHGMVDPWAVRHQRWKKVIAYAIYETNHLHGARCIRALCESEALSVRRMGLRNPVAVVPNGIDLPLNSGAEPGTSEAPWSNSMEPGRKVLLFLSRIHRKKGLDNLLRAWAKAKPRGWGLVVAGWDQGGYEGELKAMKEDLGIGDSVFFAGPLFGEAKDAAYRRADAFILPSLSEGLPMVVLEAWAYGKPVLMTPECNLPEGFAADAAIRIEGTTDGIVKGLQNLLRFSDGDLKEMGAKGRRLVEERFTWNQIATQVKETYEWMLGGGPAPAWVT